MPGRAGGAGGACAEAAACARPEQPPSGGQAPGAARLRLPVWPGVPAPYPRPLPPGPLLGCSFAASGLASRPDGVAGVHGLAGGGEHSPALQLVSCTHYLPRPAVAPKSPALWSIVALEDNTHVMYVHSPPVAPHSAQWAMQTFLHPHFVLPSNQALLKSLRLETPKRVTPCYISTKHDHCRGMSPGEMIRCPCLALMSVLEI